LSGPSYERRPHHRHRTSGIGKEIASQLASRGAEVILACRDRERRRRTVAEIGERATAAEPAVIRVDVSNHASIRDFAREYERRYHRLDVLVNNAGERCPQRNTSADGVELRDQGGYYLMTHELLGMLRRH
jgi:NAD(P)-dependent dehydrogenase (short-subunit alcohol dehydrogenase family)